MSSNLPPGVDNNTYGAPWNDEQFCVEVTMKMVIPFSLYGPVKGEALEEAGEEGADDAIDQVKGLLTTLEIEDIEIINKNVTRC